MNEHKDTSKYIKKRTKMFSKHMFIAINKEIHLTPLLYSNLSFSCLVLLAKYVETITCNQIIP